MAGTTLTPERSAMGAFCVLPNAQYKFQEPGEQMILLLRAHPATQIGWIANIVLATIVFVTGMSFFGELLSPSVFSLISFVFTVLVFVYGFYNLFVWYYNLGIVTSERIIDIDYHGVNKVVTTEARIGKISEATAKHSGFFRQIFNYGDIFVRTDGPVTDIEFYNVPNPDQVVSIVNSCVEEYKKHV